LRHFSLLFRTGISHRAIIAIFPILWGAATIIHLFNRSNLLLGHQLPMLQVIIWVTSFISTDPQIVRYVMTIIATVAAPLRSTLWLVPFQESVVLCYQRT
jgi:hypothetical protein